MPREYSAESSAALPGALWRERRLFIQTESRTRYIRFAPLTQAALALALVALIGWSAVSGVMLFTRAAEERIAAHEAAEIEDAAAARIARLVDEKRRLADALSLARLDAETAAALFTDGQTELTGALAQSHRADLALNHHRERLDALTKRHTAAVKDCADTRAKTAVLETALQDAALLRADMSAERDLLTIALNETSADRDETTLAAADLSDRLAKLEENFAARAEEQAAVYAKIEDAARLSLNGLEGVFDRASINLDRILASVRRDHAGQGGIFEPIDGAAGFITPGEDGADDARLARLFSDLERVNALRTAVEQMPFARPARGARFTSGFGNRRDPKTRRGAFHAGIDLAAPRGTPIYAGGAGEVIFSGRQSGYGNVIKIRHAFGYETVYAHLHRRRVKVGERVERGDRIGDMGNTGRSTGTHLHYEIRLNGKPVNPAKYIEAARNVL